MPSPLTLPVQYGRRKPPLGAPLTRAHPLAPNGGALWAMNEGAGSTRDCVRGVMLSPNAGATWGVSPAGRALQCNVGNDSGFYATCPSWLKLQTLSLVWYGVYYSSSASEGSGVTYTNTDNQPWLSYYMSPSSGSLLFQYNNGGGTLNQDTIGPITYGVPTHYVATYTSGQQTYWTNGVQTGGNTLSGAIVYTSNSLICAGMYVPGIGRVADSQVISMSIYPRVLSPAEIMSLCLRPFQAF